MRLFSLIIFLLISSSSFSQDTLVVYFKDDFSPSDDSTGNVGVLIRMDSIWEVNVFNVESHKKIMRGYYNSTMEHKEGLFELFHLNGNYRERGNYFLNRREGIWKAWDENGLLSDSLYYEGDTPIAHARYSYNSVAQLNSYDFEDSRNQHKISKQYSTGRLTYESEWFGRNGFVKNYYPNGNISMLTSVSREGKKREVTYFDESGNKRSLKDLERKNREAIPEFLGGKEQFQKYFERNLRVPEALKYTIHNYVIKVRFLLDDKGRATNMEVFGFSDTDLQNAVIELLEKMPAWKMNGQTAFGPLLYTFQLNIRE